jgi:hypothetical protein
MATGDNDDQFGRLKRLLPQSWFGDNAGVIDALLRGFAHVNAQLFALIAYAKLQTRINTATDGWLDMIAYDFFGNGLPRRPGQSDDSYRAWIKVNLFREKATRKAIVLVVRELTGRDPLIIEPANPIDTGAYGGPMIGYGVAGSYGSLSMPYEAFVTVYRSVGKGFLASPGIGFQPAVTASPVRASTPRNIWWRGMSAIRIFMPPSTASKCAVPEFGYAFCNNTLIHFLTPTTWYRTGPFSFALERHSGQKNCLFRRDTAGNGPVANQSLCDGWVGETCQRHYGDINVPTWAGMPSGTTGINAGHGFTR